MCDIERERERDPFHIKGWVQERSFECHIFTIHTIYLHLSFSLLLLLLSFYSVTFDSITTMHFTQNLDHMAFPPQHGGFLFHSQEENEHLPSPSCPPHLFPGGGGGGPHFLMKRSMSFSGVEKCEDDELSDDGSQLGEKKKRLNLEQVKALEKSFEIGNKLEPERKMQLAKALGLQPRQIAIWFQNRRARWKTKQLEKDYEVLKKQFDALKADNDALHAHNKKLHAELMNLKGIDSNEVNNLKKESDQRSWSNGSENSCDANIDTSPVSNHHQLTTKHLFNTSSSSIRPTSMTQLLQGSSRPDLQHQLVHQEENFCSMFNGIEEQQGYWTWPDQHHQTFSLNQQSHFSNN